MEETLANLVVFVLEELCERSIVHEDQFLGFGHVTLHQAINKHGALLQMGILTIVHDLDELLLEECFGLWCPLEKQLEDADKHSA